MMTLLRSRRTMFILAGVVIGGLVLATGIGLIQAIVASSPSATPPPPERQQGEEGQQGEGGEGGEAPEPEEPPEVADLGDPPSGLAYESEGEEGVHCQGIECVRLVEVVPEGEGAEADSEEIIDEVYDHLLAQNWGQILPEGAESPEDAANSDILMTNEDIMVADSSDHTGDSSAVLMVGHVPEDSES